MLEYPKTAFLLAASFGDRMRPLTRYLPKVLLPIGNKPILIRHIERLEQHGVERAVITLESKLGPMIQHSVAAGYEGKCKLSFVYQTNRAGLNSAVRLCEKYLALDDDSFVVVLVDEFNSTINLLKDFQGVDCDGVVGLRTTTDTNNIIQTATVRIDEGRVLSYIEKPDNGSLYKNNLCTTGSYVFDRRFFELAREAADDPRSVLANGEIGIGSTIQKAINNGLKIKYTLETGKHSHLTSIKDAKKYCF